MKPCPLLFLCLAIVFHFSLCFSQALKPAEIKGLIEKYKTDPRGPYRDIRWFCKDGTTVPPTERCPEPGNQRARYKDEVLALAKSNKVFLGQILATTPFEDFWDAGNLQSRMKQYQLEDYLRAIDDGWVLRKAQYYRGAFQAEDEEDWGQRFFEWLLVQPKVTETMFFPVRQALIDLPHVQADNRTQNIRALSKNIANSFPDFMNLRIKIHGQPDPGDLKAVKAFSQRNQTNLNEELRTMFEDLIADMEHVYSTHKMEEAKKYLPRIPKNNPANNELKRVIEAYDGSNLTLPSIRIKEISNTMMLLRKNLSMEPSAKGKLAMLDILNCFEDILFRESVQWAPTSVFELLNRNYYLAQAVAAAGFLELWEWENIQNDLRPTHPERISYLEYMKIYDTSKRLIEWGTGTVTNHYSAIVRTFSEFEPLASEFIDDRIRGSLLLHLGASVKKMGDENSRLTEPQNSVLTLSDQTSLRGLNPGIALGELVVLNKEVRSPEFMSEKIYVMEKPPGDLKPVAGIATVSEGNLVSHVQLLARNLGIPNCVVSLDNLNELKAFSGRKIFFAVSRKGNIIMKLAENMTVEESQLFKVKKTQNLEEAVEVPTSQLLLETTTTVNLRDIRSSDSGRLCGPKAANLGQLKYIFPDNVVEGFVIPFGIFKSHMTRPIPGKAISYWDFLNQTFQEVERLKGKQQPPEEIEAFTLQRLSELRDEIKKMRLDKAFIEDLTSRFKNVLGSEIGKIPVFIRSDTNMEDLKDFTGAGLNLTVFNVLNVEDIFQGIKDVWASPYQERSYKWRQKFLTNPENVYPSILIIPSVNVEKSGVMITTGLTSNNPEDLTVAFSRGAGGAVEGQQAETYLLMPQKIMLLSPSRERAFNTLPVTGGTGKGIATLESPILSFEDLAVLREVAARMKQELIRSASADPSVPLDIELGFKDGKFWLFQVRPFVENKKAQSINYLNQISPVFSGEKTVELKEPIEWGNK